MHLHTHTHTTHTRISVHTRSSSRTCSLFRSAGGTFGLLAVVGGGGWCRPSRGLQRRDDAIARGRPDGTAGHHTMAGEGGPVLCSVQVT